MHTNTFCKYRKKLLASPRVHLVSSKIDFITALDRYFAANLENCCMSH